MYIIIVAEERSVASCRAHEEESPGNIEHHTWQRQAGGDVGENVTENNRLLVFDIQVRVKRRGKSPPGAMATWHAAHPMGCKAKYTGS